MKKTGMSLMEVMVVVVIISILSTLALAQYGTYKESSLDREARANLRLMVAAQRIYRMEAAAYYPVAPGSVNLIQNINDNLRLFLNNSGNRPWNYLTSSTAAPAACAQATRFQGPNARTWRLRNTETDPVSGTCP